MKNKQLIPLAICGVTMLFGCLPQDKSGKQLSLIPFPDSVVCEQQISNCKGLMTLESNLNDSSLTHFRDYLKSVALYGQDGTGKENQNILALRLQENPGASPEAYELNITKKRIDITASSEAGLYYGLQTLLQLRNLDGNYPIAVIRDTPRFAYRGLHLDVSRHFFSTDFIKKQLDQMAALKLNTFHWHLTDGAGWRLQIDKYPKLTEVAAWRPYANWKEWSKGGAKYCDRRDPKAQGGFYTKDEVRDIVAYAAERHITVIPEIELPGHSEEVLAVYPELSCTGQPYKHSDFCVGNEETFTFLENVFDEVLELFPSQMIHIGGDEAAKSAWKKCPKCAKRMADNNLKDVDELQSYMIRRVGSYLNSKGRTFVGWDEILEGGLADNAVVMSWRGEEGGIAAVRSGHDAIMTPGAFCYFDAYQLNPATQPEAISGYLPVERVYSYNPVPDSLSAEEGKRIRGVQANVWTEYIPTEQHAEYMIYPRLLALAEVAWSRPERKSWEDFKPRLNKYREYMQKAGYQPAPLNEQVMIEQQPDTLNGTMVVTLRSDIAPAKIYYTLDGTSPNERSVPYKEPVVIKDPTLLSAVVYADGKSLGESVQQRISYSKSIGAKVTYNAPYSAQYPAGGDQALVNGLLGAYGYSDGRWQGFLKGMDVVVDLGAVRSFNTVKARFMQIIGPWVWMPTDVEVFISDDGIQYTSVYTEKNSVPVDQEGVIFKEFGFEERAEKLNGRYVRYVAKPYKGFLFTDELIIE